MGSKPGDPAGGVATVNGSTTIMPPGVNGDDFQTMVHSLQNQDLLDHSIGGGPPMDNKGNPLNATDISSEARFRAISAGIYHVYLADGSPAAGTGPGGLYAFKIDAKGVSDILARPQQPGLSINSLPTGGPTDFLSGAAHAVGSALQSAGHGIAAGLHAMSHGIQMGPEPAYGQAPATTQPAGPSTLDSNDPLISVDPMGNFAP
jgi:hypothetical protein